MGGIHGQYLLVGHVTHDVAPDGNKTVGGTVTHAARVAKSLGWEPHIVTAAGVDFTPPDSLADVQWSIQRCENTTTVRNDYSTGKRLQTFGPIAAPVDLAAIAADVFASSLVHLGPVAQEVDATGLVGPRRQFLGATLQGWLRRWDAGGKVTVCSWEQAATVLPRLAAAVVSIEDVAGDWGLLQQWASHVPMLVVTQGAGGCALMRGSRWDRIAPRAANVVHPTGAGDVFAAVFFLLNEMISDPVLSARLANLYASMAIERPGLDPLPTLGEVQSCLVD